MLSGAYLELALVSHVHRISGDCYLQLCQLRTVTRSLASAATATLVHSFVWA